jgi:four helix bundle protein
MNDLQKRLIAFAGEIIILPRELRADSLLTDCIRQLIRSGSSAGANYSEAQSANSMRDFHNKIRISLKEIKESDYWIGLLLTIYPGNLRILNINKECTELMKILGTISKKTDPNHIPKSTPSGNADSTDLII